MSVTSRTERVAARGVPAPVRRSRRRWWWWILWLPVAGMLVLGMWVPYAQPRPPPFSPSFAGPDRLVTNARAFQSPDAPGVRHSDDWRVTSGSLFVRDGTGWTGRPDRVSPNASSTNGTGSAVFRTVSRRADFRDVTVSLRIRVEALTAPADRHAYDGAHLFLRYRGPDELYGVTVFRRDGMVTLKRKLPGPEEPGNYVTLAAAHRPQPMNRWIDVRARVATLEDGSVRLSLTIDGERVLTATDRGKQGHPITGAGRVGVRGDNCQFSFADFRAEPDR